MKRTTKYVALDVHQATTVASVRWETGWVIARERVADRRSNPHGVLPGMRGTIHVARLECAARERTQQSPKCASEVLCFQEGVFGRSFRLRRQSSTSKAQRS